MSVNRREFIRSVGLAGAGLAAARAAHGQAGRLRGPNILFIMTDQQPASCAGPYGNPVIQTPALDELARRGCKFERFYIAGFPCSPSRASMITGRYPHNHGVVINDVGLDESIPGLGNICRAAGYDTGYFGKWHLGGNMYRGREDRRAAGLGGDWVYERIPDDNDFRFRAVPGGLGEDAPQAGFDTWAGGWRHYHDYLRRVGLGDLLDKNPGVGNHNGLPSAPEGSHMHSLLPEEHHMEAFFAQEAEQFIRERGASGRPWCAVLSFFGPHLPVAPPRPWNEIYGLDQVTLPDNHRDVLEGKPVRQRTNSRCYVLPRWNDEQFKDYIRRYWGFCSYIDQQIARVFGALQQTGQWDNTIVIFTSDHGDMVGAHGMIFKLGACGYEELYRVPTLMHIPGVTRPGARCDALAENVDFLPTILQAAGIAAPDGMDGVSLLPLLAGGAEPRREFTFADCSNSSLVLRDERYKFVLNWKSRDLDELYDLETDPGEMTNLAYEANHGPTMQLMNRRALERLERAGHPYAAVIAAQAARQPETRVLEISARAADFTHLGGNEFEMAIVWSVTKPIEAEGKYWAFTQFCNPRYATDGDIVFRFTPWPEPPVSEWRAEEEYRVGPVRVQVPDHAGSGDYRVRTGLYDPERRKGPGVILGGDGNAMVVGTLTIRREGERVTDISFTPAH